MSTASTPATATAAAAEEKKDDASDVPVSSLAMKLLDLKLKPSGAILQSVIGDFLPDAQQAVCLAKTSGVLELYQLTPFKLVHRIDTHSILRQITTVRLTGDKRELLAVASDSGALSIIDFTKAPHAQSQTIVYGKTQCRRSTPGQYIAADPKGRAVLVSAIEKRKLVFVLNHTSGSTTIASPLEAHRNRTLAIATAGVDNGYDNPLFAVIEQPLPDDEEPSSSPSSLPGKQLAYYELDLGLNHVSRKWATSVPDSSNCLVALPGGAEGPSGVLVGHDNAVTYYHPDLSGPISCRIPRRKWEADSKPTLVQSLTMHRQKKNKFFGLCQSELGDVYKVSVDVNMETNQVTALHLALLDTLPVANSLNVSKKGLLFLAAESADHALYQFERIDLPDAPTNTSTNTAVDAAESSTTFIPTHLKNLVRLASLDNPTPTTGVLVGELAGTEVSPQIYAIGGKGPTSSLRILRHGASVVELAVSELPGVPGNIYSVSSEDSSLTQYIVVSFADATLVLSVEAAGVEEVGRESGFLTNAPTLSCSALRGGSLCQVHPSGVRHIQRGQAKQWHCPGLKRIECASANLAQVLIALAGGEVIYFEMDSLSGNLTESATKDMGADVCCLDVASIPQGTTRSLFAAVGCRDQTVKIVSLEAGAKLLQQKSSLALTSRPHSVSLQSTSSGTGTMILMIGLDDGSCLRATVDPVTGTIGTSPTRRFLGARPVSVSHIPLQGKPSMLLLSSRPWISHHHSTSGEKHIMAPLSYTPLDHGCAFSSDAVPEGVVATAGKTLRIISVDTSGMEGGEEESFNTNKVALRYTPRQMTLLSAAAAAEQQRKVVLAVVESDCNDYGEEEKKSMGFDPTGGLDKKNEKNTNDGDAMDMDEDSEDEDAGKKENDGDEDDEDDEEQMARATAIRGPVPPEPGHWGSCIRLMDPSDSCRTLHCLEMGRNEAALCCCSVRFHTRGGESLLAVGTVTGMTLNPLKQSASHVVLYRIVNCDSLQLLHRTSIEDGPVLALAHFQGRLLVGIGKTLRLYEMGKRQLLRKCELRGLPTIVKTLQTAGERAYFGDMMRSLHIVRYEPTANRLVLVASDASPRPIVSQELLDWNTVAVGDKFGNICVLRLPRGADTTGALDVTGQRALWGSSRETTPRMEVLCQYHVGEVVTSMARSSLVAGGEESLIYVTVSGRIGALVPFTSRDDVEFYTQLEDHLRSDAPRPTGRDPRSYRSYYAPAMHVADGDLCQTFNSASLSTEQQKKIADRLEMSVGQVTKKLEDSRNQLF